MTALRAPQPDGQRLQSVPPQQAHLKQLYRHKRHAHQANRQRQTELVLETTTKLCVNLLLITAMGAALVKLWPYHQTQQQKLEQVQAEMQRTEQRVESTQANFNRAFDPQQARTLMQEQTNLVDPHQRQIVWVDPYQSED